MCMCDDTYELHGSHKAKIWSRYAMTMRKYKHNTKENHQATRKERKERNREIAKQPENDE